MTLELRPLAEEKPRDLAPLRLLWTVLVKFELSVFQVLLKRKFKRFLCD